jgi:hypothetical protein
MVIVVLRGRVNAAPAGMGEVDGEGRDIICGWKGEMITWKRMQRNKEI